MSYKPLPAPGADGNVITSTGTAWASEPGGGGGGGGITSVNGDTGPAVVLDAADVGADAAGTAASAIVSHVAQPDPHTQYQRESEKGAANGYASLDGTTKVPIAQLPTGSTSTTVTIGNDSRLSNARTPTAHAASHASGGSDPITPAAIGAEVAGEASAAVAAHVALSDPHTQYALESSLGNSSTRNVGTTAGTVAAGDDVRFPASAPELLANKGAVNGYAALDGTTKVPIAQLPTGTNAVTVALGDAPANAISAHVALSNPHSQYQREADKNAANGYPGLNGASKIAFSQLPTGPGATEVAIGTAPTTAANLAVDAHSALSSGVHGITAAGQALTTAASVAAQRLQLGLGNSATLNVGTTAGTVAAGNAAPIAHASTHASGGSDPVTPAAIGAEVAGAVAAHNALTSGVHGITAAGAALTTAANAAAQRTALGLATVATSGSASDLTTGTLPAARLPASGVTPGSYTSTNITVGADGRITAASNGGGGLSPLGLFEWWTEARFGNNNAAAMDFFIGAAVSAGSNTTAIPVQAIRGVPAGVFIRSGTTANGGYRYQTSSLVGDTFGISSRKFWGQFLFRNLTNITVRMGYLDTATSADAVDGAYFQIVGSTCSAKTADTSTRTTNATTLTLTVNTMYTFDIEVNAAATSARFRVYEEQNTTPVLDVTNTTNIPNKASTPFGTGIVATESTTTATDIGVLYMMGSGTIDGFLRARGQP